MSSLAFLREGYYDLLKVTQRLVDIFALLLDLLIRISFISPLAACQVNQVQLTRPDGVILNIPCFNKN